MPLFKAQIQGLIPHSGEMLLLAQVTALDETSLDAWADGHRDADHPLRVGGRLPASAGIEYAAQAIATHTALITEPKPNPPIGYLAVLTGVNWTAPRLDDIDGRLLVHVTRLSATNGGLLYEFTISGPDGPRVTGRQLIALMDEEGGFALG